MAQVSKKINMNIMVFGNSGLSDVKFTFLCVCVLFDASEGLNIPHQFLCYHPSNIESKQNAV